MISRLYSKLIVFLPVFSVFVGLINRPVIAGHGIGRNEVDLSIRNVELDKVSDKIIEMSSALISGKKGSGGIDPAVVEGLIGDKLNWRLDMADDGKALEIGVGEVFECILDRDNERIFARNVRDSFESNSGNASKVQVQAKALQILHQMNIVDVDEESLEVRSLMVQENSEFGELHAPREIAYKIFVGRKIEGVKVLGSRIVLSFFLDGSLHKIHAHWPAFENKNAIHVTKEMIQAKVNEALGASPLQASKDLEVDAGFTIEDGKLRPAVVVSGTLENGIVPGEGRQGVLEVRI